jgi:phage terminase large subunit GpA-like protein
MIRAVLPAEELVFDVMPSFRPRASVDSWDWICKKGRMPDGTPFDGDRIPWCRGVAEAWDNPVTRMISLMWGTRLGKTTIGLQLMAKVADTKPMPGLFATSTQTLAERTVRNKIYPVLSSIEATRKQLPHRRFWTMKEVRLSSAPWFVAWSGSDTQLADLSAFYGYANEVDKWSMNEKQGGESGEGDPFEQFLERFKEFYNAKILSECSPSTKRRSRIEKQLLASNNCRYNVPCPKCGTHQVLKLGTEGEPGGIRFDRRADGSSDPALARSTARYECVHCRYEIADHQRPAMMRAGVWVPAGQHVDKRGRLQGTPLRGPRLWGGQLSSLYSLQLRWGDIAEKFVQVKDNSRELRMFINGWLAETWEPFKPKSEPEEVGLRLATDDPRGVIPSWAKWLFAAVDIQHDHFVFWVVAIDENQREHLVDHGTLDTLAEVETKVIRREFEHADGGPPLCPIVTAIDCGFRSKMVYEFCQKFKQTSHRVMPVKGANSDCAGEPFEVKLIGAAGQNDRTKRILARAGKGLRRIRVSPYYYEPITQEQLDDLNPGDFGSLSLHTEAREDLDLLNQLCNGAESDEPSKLDPNRHLWVKRWEGQPNDYRDGKKYARCMADWYFKRDWEKAARRQGVAIKTADPMAKQSPAESTRERYRPSRTTPRERRISRQ